MIYAIIPTGNFERNFKQLSKKYRSLDDDYEDLINELLKNPLIGDDLGENTRKVRMSIASKNKGKRGGARVITCNVMVDVENSEIYLLTIYDKSKQETISKEEIQLLKKMCGLI